MNLILTPLALIIGLAIGYFVANAAVKSKVKAALFDQSTEIQGLTNQLNQALGAKNTLQLELDATKAKLQEVPSTNATIEELARKVKELEGASTSLTNLMGKDSAFQSQIASITQSTTELARTLSNSQKRGSIGEAQLEQLFKQAGLLPGTHYQTQFSMEIEGKALRPDVKIELMDGNIVYIDAKFPFANFSKALEATDPLQRAALMKEHATDLLAHAKKLGAKNYSTSDGSLPYVILFAPVENLLYEALEADPDLINKMSRENVTIATPATMMALLHTIHHLFNRTAFAQNLKLFDKLATQIVSQVQVVNRKLVTLADKFEASEEALNDLIKSTAGRLTKPANEMIKLGARTGSLEKEIDPAMPIHVEMKLPKVIEFGEVDELEELGED
jgi:DNA recombination protein RmuC